MKQIPRILIGAPTSGSGKTTFTIGLLRALRNKGLRVQPFKVGPDFIDTRFHELACGLPSVNLDRWMTGDDYLHVLLNRYEPDADLLVCEGAMGFFDGCKEDYGSAADIGRMLSFDCTLVMDGSSMGYTAGYLLKGLAGEESCRIRSVVFNKVGSPIHAAMLGQGAEKVANLYCAGFLPRNATVRTPSRHLGLSIDQREEMERFIEEAAKLVERHIDIDRFIAIHTVAGESHKTTTSAETHELTTSRPVIAIACDEAFNFIYTDTLYRFGQLASRVCFFSPLHNEPLPADADIVYLPGGYPELYAERLGQSSVTMTSLKSFAEKGGKIWAECGGMLYLSALLSDMEGTTWPMAGVLPFHATMEHAHLHLGYRRFCYGGKEYRGHEFHYSHLINPEALPSIATQYNVRNEQTDTPVYRYKNVFASYTHIYWGTQDITDFYSLS